MEESISKMESKRAVELCCRVVRRAEGCSDSWSVEANLGMKEHYEVTSLSEKLARLCVISMTMRRE